MYACSKLLSDIFIFTRSLFYFTLKHLVNTNKTRKFAKDGPNIELPTITPHTVAEKRMAVLWLRFLTEIDDDTQTPSADLQENPDINKALEEVEVTAFTEEELRGYDKFWDIVRTEKTLLGGSYEKGHAEGRAEGIAEGRAEGIAEGERKEKLATAKRLLDLGLAPDIAAQGSGLTIEEIKDLIR